jgi:hypothetical protein
MKESPETVLAPARDPGTEHTGNKLRTLKILSMEFIGNEALEGIEERVDPSQPGKPGMHLRRRDHESCIDDND